MPIREVTQTDVFQLVKDLADNDVTFRDIKSSSYNTGINSISLSAAGMYQPSIALGLSQEPKLSIELGECNRFFEAVGSKGLAIGSGNDFGSAEVYYVLVKEQTVGRDSHNKIASVYGYLVPMAVNAPQDGQATVSAEYHFLYDDSLDPQVDIVTKTDDINNLPNTPVDEVYTLGPIFFNGTQLNNVVGWSLDFNIEVITIRSAGATWPTFSSGMVMKPQLKITFSETTPNFNQIEQWGNAVTNVNFYLTKRAGYSARRVPNATAEHVKFHFDKGYVRFETAQGTYEGRNDVTMVIDATQEVDTSDVMNVTANSAITA